MAHCAGCHCNFSVSGYTHHIRLTQSSSCAAAYHAQLGHINDNEIEEGGGGAAFLGDFGNAEDEDDSAAFAGDFFGDYQDEDFDWPDEGMSTVIAYLHLLTIVQVMIILFMIHQLLRRWTRASM
jgi:hypothetical protein